MGIVRNKLFENPDRISIGKINTGWMSAHAYPFGYWKGKLYIAKNPGDTHGSIEGWREIEEKLPTPPDNAYGVLGKPRYYMENSGRLWKDRKVMSFWKYPKKEEFKKIIDEIGKAIGQPDMFNDPEWKVEVVTGINKKYSNKGKDINKDWDRSNIKYTQELIPLKDYVKSNERTKKDLATQHNVSPIEKIKMQRPDRSQFFRVRDKKEKPLAWKQAMYAESMIVRPTINESPDMIQADNLKTVTGSDNLNFRNNDAIAFGYYGKKRKKRMLVSMPGDAHYQLGNKENYNIMKYSKMFDKDIPNIDRTDLTYPGRLWKNEKIISFWTYPPKNELVKILSDIEKEYEKRFNKKLQIDNTWYIEIIEKKIKGVKPDPRDSGDWNTALDAKLIPIKDYTGSKDQSDEEKAKQHVASPMQKLQRKDKSYYFKVIDSKEKPLAWKQALVKSESMTVRNNITSKR